MYLLFTPCLHFWKWSKIVARVARRIWKKSLIFYECVHIWIPSPPPAWNILREQIEGRGYPWCMFIHLNPAPLPVKLVKNPCKPDANQMQARFIRGKGLLIPRCGFNMCTFMTYDVLLYLLLTPACFWKWSKVTASTELLHMASLPFAISDFHTFSKKQIIFCVLPTSENSGDISRYEFQ